MITLKFWVFDPAFLTSWRSSLADAIKTTSCLRVSPFLCTCMERRKSCQANCLEIAARIYLLGYFFNKIRGAVNKFASFNGSRAGAKPKPTLSLHMISLIKNALWPVTLYASYNQIIGVVWRHPKIGILGPLQPMSGWYLGSRRWFSQSRD